MKALFNKQKAVIFLAMVLLGAVGLVQISRNDNSPHRRGTLLPARPAISGLAPDIVTQQGAAFKLTVMGSNFSHGSTVLWNGSSRPTKFLNSNTLVAQISASDIEKADQVPIQVTNPGLEAVPSNFSVTVSRAIAFVSGRALGGSDAANKADNIWITRGTDAVPLTNLRTRGADSASPVWSPDGTGIAFCSSRTLDGSDGVNANFTVNLWVMNADGSGVRPLTNLTAYEANSCAPMWSPDGTRIAFCSARALDGSDAANANATVNLWVMNADGSGTRPLTKLTVQSVAAHYFSSLSPGGIPSWSPDGSRIVFVSPRALNGSDAENINEAPNIWIMNADGSGAHALTRFTAVDLSTSEKSAPIWSPDSTQIIFESSRVLDRRDAASTNRPVSLWLMNPDGSQARQVIFESARALDSRDAANANRTVNLWVMKANGSHARPLTRLRAAEAESITPAWSPDGARIAFLSARALNGQDAANTNRAVNLWVMNADGSQVRPLTKLTADGAASVTPAWSPDGARIAFLSAQSLDGQDAANTDGTLNLWVMNADGSQARPLTRLRAAGANSVTEVWAADYGMTFYQPARWQPPPRRLQ